MRVIAALMENGGTCSDIAQRLGTRREHVSAAIQQIKNGQMKECLVEQFLPRATRGRKHKYYSWREHAGDSAIDGA